MSIFLVSDWHFNHDKPFIYETRGFKTIEEMNEAIIQRHNALVQPNDDVYVLGDLALGGVGEHLDLIKQMNGWLHLVQGNHDTSKKWETYLSLPNVVEMGAAFYLKYKKYYFFLSHYPCFTSNFEDNKRPWQRVLSVSGHTHSKNEWNEGMSYNVCMEAHNCFPVNIEDIISAFKREDYNDDK